MRLRLREDEKLARGHKAEPGLKYSAGRGDEPYPCLPSLPSVAPPTKPQVKPPQLSPPEGQTLQTTSGSCPAQQLPPLCLSKATLSSEASERKGRALAQNDPREWRQLQIQAGYHLIPTPSVPAPTLSGPGMPPLGPSVYMAGPWLP